MAFNFDPELMLQLSAGLLSGKTGQEQAANAFGNAGNYMALRRTKQEDQARLNKSLEYLRTANPQLAQAVEAGVVSPADAWKLDYQQKLQAQTPKKPNLMNVGGNIYNADTGQWIAPPEGIDDGEEYGLNPVWGKDENGKTVLGQVSKRGKFKPLDTGGFIPTPGINNTDIGTAVITRNNRTGEIITTTPKDLAGAEMQKGAGKATAEAMTQLGSARQIAGLIDSQINDLKNDPSLASVLGPVDSRTPNIFPNAVRVQAKIDQIKGGAFLQARQMLKGGGAITDFEGRKAEAAFARMDQAQSEEDFKAALDDFNSAVKDGVKKLEMAAQGNLTGAQQGGNTTSSGVQWKVK